MNRSLRRVGLTVSLKGIKMVETDSSTVLMDYSIYRCRVVIMIMMIGVLHSQDLLLLS